MANRRNPCVLHVHSTVNRRNPCQIGKIHAQSAQSMEKSEIMEENLRKTRKACGNLWEKLGKNLKTSGKPGNFGKNQENLGKYRENVRERKTVEPFVLI